MKKEEFAKKPQKNKSNTYEKFINHQEAMCITDFLNRSKESNYSIYIDKLREEAELIRIRYKKEIDLGEEISESDAKKIEIKLLRKFHTLLQRMIDDNLIRKAMQNYLDLAPPEKSDSSIELLQECKIQLEYLNEKFGQTGTTNALLAKIDKKLNRL